MIREALEYLIGLAAPKIEDINGVHYSSKSLSPILPYGRGDRSAVEFKSLAGFCDYLRDCAAMENFSMSDAFVVLNGANSAAALSRLDRYGRRYDIARLEFSPDFSFALNQYQSVEAFIAGLMRFFRPGVDLDELIELTASISAEHSATIKDNGISQEVCVKEGVNYAMKPTKRFYELAPRRCLPELGDVRSKFFVRVKPDGEKAVKIMMSEATFDEWGIEVRTRFKKYLNSVLAGWMVME